MSHTSSTSRGGCCGGSSSTVMRSGNVTAVAAKSGGCSCGGSCGGGGSCGCNCGGCQGGEGFARPRFFAGQLLTEDDLALLESYVVEKNRLHNRSFFGEGVVCGLMVTCDPCGGGKVAVQSGYALDCCGNDIVVSCKQTVDINALVRRLRIERNGGVDCGDPCTETKSAAATATLPATTGMIRGIRTNDPPPLPAAEYCLYVRYCERPTDPVSPYATDDPCGAQACEPTRVQEGFTFELRCRTCDEDEPDNLFTHIAACIGDLKAIERSALSMRSTLLYASRLDPALDRISSPDSARNLVNVERLDAATTARARLDALPKKVTDWNAGNVYDAADAVQTLASLVVAAQSLSDADRQSLDDATQKGLDEGVKNAQLSLARFKKVAPDDTKVAALIGDPLDRDIVSSTLKQSMLLSTARPETLGVMGGERQMLAGGVVYSKQIRSSISTSMGRVKATLIDRLGKRGAVTDCMLLRDVQAIQIPDDDPASEPTSSNAIVASSALRQLMDALQRYLRECICSALNPPCPPCDDPAVLLACLRVEGCEVRDICNLERTFVLTPVAFRYWMPFLRSFGNILERMCCDSDACDPPKQQPDPDGPGRVRVPLRAGFSELAQRSTIERNSALNLANSWVGSGKSLDPTLISAMLPARLSFSADDAQSLVTSTAAMLDIAGMSRGIAPGELLNLLVKPGVDTPAIPPPAPAPAPSVDLSGMRKEIEDLQGRLKSAEERSSKFEARIKKLEQ